MKPYQKILIRLFALILLFVCYQAEAQVDSMRTHVDGRIHSPFATFQATARKINDVHHTRLSVSFDFAKQYLYGEEWVTLTPHFYPVDSVVLNAQGMDIAELDMVKNGTKTPLNFTYKDSLHLHIKLDHTYYKGQFYELYIKYTAKPNDLKPAGGSAISDSKGLYFINPEGKNPYEPTQIWTQGELNSNSCWFPTIDHPNQKSTEEIDIRVPKKYTTLSNGTLTSQKDNGDGTRTDTWKMGEPNAIYLFMMAVGEFHITHDHWKDIPVDYYLEPAYAPYAKDIFGRTPEMIGYFSKILGIDYPWSKYSQVVVREYVSGAMENTTATLHGDFVQGTHRELIDGNHDDVICHELFHHWFGDYVTTESWSNITLNESFANFSEYLWLKHYYGADRGGEKNYEDMHTYFDMNGEDHPLVDYYYKSPLSVFDNVSYEKGGRILNMLRDFVGDSAFFASLHLYLTEYAHGNAEAAQLREAFEKVTGRDLHWFWQQWYYGEGYPVIDVTYKYNDDKKVATVMLAQTQNEQRIFKLPMFVDVYTNGQKKRIPITLDTKLDTLRIPYVNGKRPELINVDGDKLTLAQFNDKKTIDNYLAQYNEAGLYLDRREAIEGCAPQQTENKDARDLLLKALRDPFSGLRELAMDSLNLDDKKIHKKAMPIITELAQKDSVSKVRAAAISRIAQNATDKDMPLFENAIKDSSYAVQGAALEAIYQINPEEGLKDARNLMKDSRADLSIAIANILADGGNESDTAFFYETYAKNPYTLQLGIIVPYAVFLTKINNPNTVQRAAKLMADQALIFNSANILSPVMRVLSAVRRTHMNNMETANYIESLILQLKKRLKEVQ